MDKSNLILQAYLPIILGVILLIFNRLITESYERIAQRDGSSFPKFITTTKVFVSAIALVFFGLSRLIVFVA